MIFDLYYKVVFINRKATKNIKQFFLISQFYK